MLSLMRIAVLSLVLFATACTNIRVRPIDRTAHQITHLCIRENPKVIVPNFLNIVKDQFAQHQITTEVFSADKPPGTCVYTLDYTANMTWDMSTYMYHAELQLRKGDELISAGNYDLRNGGGLSLAKWASTESKMKPVIDQMLNGVTPPKAKKAARSV